MLQICYKHETGQTFNGRMSGKQQKTMIFLYQHDYLTLPTKCMANYAVKSLMNKKEIKKNVMYQLCSCSCRKCKNAEDIFCL